MKKMIYWSTALSIFLLCTRATYGYIYGNMKWYSADLPVTYYFNQNGTPDCDGEFTALQSSLQTWEDECRSFMDFSYGGTTTATNAGTNNGTNICYWAESATDPVYLNALGYGYIASNIIWASGDHHLDRDVAFNGVDFTWGTGGEATRMDVQNIATHEFGHSLRLRDVYAPVSVNGAKTMYGIGSAGQTIKRTLEQDDRDGIAYIYPSNTNERVWIKDAADDFGCTPYTGSVFWESPDIRLVPYPPVLGGNCTIYVTGRNMYATAQTATITVEVHDPAVNLNAGPPYLWTSTLSSQTIPAAHDSLIEGKREFSFPWFVDPNTFEEGHFCIIATVQTSGDVITNPWSPADNDVAQRNIHITEGMVDGSAVDFTFNAGNPTGEDVEMTLHIDRSQLRKGWEASFDQYPEDSPIPLTSKDTFLPVRLILAAPRSQTQSTDGDFSPVHVTSQLLSLSTKEIIGGGGIACVGIVGTAHDVGTTALFLPPGEIDVGTPIFPKAMVKNFRDYEENFPVVCTISDDAYTDTQYPTLAPGEEKEVIFAQWLATGSGHEVRVQTLHPLDPYPDNDAQSGTVAVKGFDSRDTTRAVAEDSTPFALLGCHPNPFDNSISISYFLPFPTSVQLRIYDVTGRTVKTLVEQDENSGTKHAVWDGTADNGRHVAPGVYFIHLETGINRTVEKLILLR